MQAIQVSDVRREIAERLQRFRLSCKVELQPEGKLTLNNWYPFNQLSIMLAFPTYRIKKTGKKVWSDRPDDQRESYFVDLEPI